MAETITQLRNRMSMSKFRKPFSKITLRQQLDIKFQANLFKLRKARAKANIEFKKFARRRR